MHYVPKFPATVILCLCFLYADTVSPDYHQFTQPDGSTFWGRGYGDEFYSISETRDGYTFIHAVNSEGRSAYYYVSLDADGVFIQSELQVGIDDPDLAGISKGLRETPAVIQRKRDAVLSKFLPLNWDVTENRAGSDKYKKPLIILANFQSGGYPAGVSASFYASYTTADFGKLFFSDNLATDTFSADPGNYQTNHYDRSMKQAFLENSYNQFSLTATVSDVTAWTQAPQTYAYYCYGSQGSGGAWPHNAQGLAYDLVNLLDASVDFSQYDLDVDGIVDQIIIIVEGWTDPTGTNDDMFWSYRWSIPDAYAPVLDGVAVKGFFLTQEKMGSDGYADFNGDGFSNTQIYTQGSLRTVGTIVHEYGHSLGLPDLYDTNSGNGDSEGIGEWGLMGSGNWNSQICPASMTAWSKSELGWLTPTEISVFQDNLTVVNIEDNATAYKIPFSETEYFLIANRQRTGLDSFLNSTAGGLIIWHIDDEIIDHYRYEGSNDVNADETHKGMDVEEAEGAQDLDDNANRGEAGDIFPGGDTSFTPSSTPDSDSYVPQETGVSLTDISLSARSSDVILDVLPSYVHSVVQTADQTIVVTYGQTPGSGADTAGNYTVTGNSTVTVNSAVLNGNEVTLGLSAALLGGLTDNLVFNQNINIIPTGGLTIPIDKLGTIFSGSQIGASTTWTKAESPYYLTGNVTVPSGSTLTLEAGTEVRFMGTYSIYINGVLLSQGTSSDSVRITSNASSPAASDWNYLSLDDRSTAKMDLQYTAINYGHFAVAVSGSTASPTLSMSNCTIENSYYGILFDQGTVNATVSECLIKTSTNYGISCQSCVGMTILNSVIDGVSGFDCIKSTGSSSHPVITNCTLLNANQAGVILFDSALATVLNTITSDNNYGLWKNAGVTLNANYCTGNNNIADHISVTGSNNTVEDPRLNADYTLQTSPLSPCIDDGDPDSQYDDPDGSRNDKGAKYFHQGTNMSAGDWNSASTWSGGFIPSASGQNVTIGYAVTLTDAARTVNNLTLDGGSLTMSSSGSLTVDGTLTLTNGNIISSDSNLLTVSSSGSISGGGASSYVSGVLARGTASTDEYLFPVGINPFAPVSIRPADASGSVFKVGYTNNAYSDLNTGASLSGISNDEYWEIERTGGSTLIDSLKLYWDSRSDFAGNGMTINNLAIARFSTVWNKEGRDDWNGDFAATGWAIVSPPTDLSGETAFTFGKSTTLGLDDLTIPGEFSFSPAYPNPFNPITSVLLEIPRLQHVSVNVYNSNGQWVESLQDGIMHPGVYTLNWDGSSQSSGVYFLQLTSGDLKKTRKIMLLK